MSYNSKYKGAEVDAALDLANTALQEHQDISGLATKLELEAKVDKVEGKQLSTEDFTTVLKDKLEGLSNYDDTTISEAVEKLRTDFDTLVSGDTTTAIKTFNEIIAFLDGIEDSQSLDSIIASIEQQIAAKYTKPSTGIPKSDLASDIQTSLGKADTALQEETYKGTVKSITAGDGLEGGTITESGTISLTTVVDEGKVNIAPMSNYLLALGNSTTNTSMSSVSNNVTLPSVLSFDKYGRVTGNTTATKAVKILTFNEATTSLKGLMSASDKTKLDGIDMTAKQDTLVSGTNIKTINGESILGSGDITIEGGSGSNEFYYWDLTDGINDSGTIPLDFPSSEVQVIALTTNGYIFLSRISNFLHGVYNEMLYEFEFDLLLRTYTLTTKKIINSETSSGGSAAYSLVEHGTSDTTFTLTPNTFHVWDEVASLDLSFGDETSGVANEFLFQFTSGATATTLTLPDDIKWANDTAPTIAENMIYQVSVLRGLASVLEFSNEAELIENNATIIDSKSITFDYPVASDVTISFLGKVSGATGAPTSQTVTIYTGEQSVTPGYTIYSIDSITPVQDDTYIYGGLTG